MRKLDPFAIYKTPKMKKLLSKILNVVIIFAILYAVIELILVHNFDYMAYIGSSGFATVLTIIILSWVIFLILNGRFHPEEGAMQPRQGYKPQRRQPTQPLQYEEVQKYPIQIETSTCNYCGREYPVSELEDVVYENRIYKICRDCLNE